VTQEPAELPVPVRDYPHWRVNFRPADYDPLNIASLGEAWELVKRTKVSLRGWVYPHISRDQRANGRNWVSSWSDFMGHIEYWRLYQSAQFLHLFVVREATEESWRRKLLARASNSLSTGGGPIEGALDILNFVYTVSEVVEFAARLAESGAYKGSIHSSIELHDVQDFALVAPDNRAPLIGTYKSSMPDIESHWDLEVRSLLGDRSGMVLKIILWFFERFGWFDPPVEVLRQDIKSFLPPRP
jgi:hypothetical protein